MKAWTMPKVVITGFVANEYISSCMDINNDNHHAFIQLTKTSTCDTNGSDGGWGYPSRELVGDSALTPALQQRINSGNVHGQYVWINIGYGNDARATELGAVEIQVENSSNHWAKVYGWATGTNTSYRLGVGEPVPFS